MGLVTSAVARLNAVRAAAQVAAAAAAATLPVGASCGDTADPQTPADCMAVDLKTRLAVRGWVNPRALLELDADPDLAMQALNAVAPDVETLFETRPGDWYLSVTSRRRVLARRGRDVIRDELLIERCASDFADPTRNAFRQEFGIDPLVPLGVASEDLLRALGCVRDWLAEEGAEPRGRAEILAELAARERRNDIARMTAAPMIGAQHRDALAELVGELTRPPQPQRELTARYVYGAGGAGKSTLLAHLQQRLADHPSAPVIARLDFDDRRINPLDPASLDLAFFDQLGVALPEVARRFEQTLTMLRGVRRRQRDDQAAYGGARRPRRKMGMMSPASLEAEGAAEREKSERDSILYGILGNEPALEGRAVVLLLDTAEVVIAQGPAAVLEVVKWLDSISASLLAPCLRVIVAGRDRPSPNPALDLVETIHGHGHIVFHPIELAELAPDEAAALLESCGVTDPDVAREAAAALPGNPLLLHMAADALTAEPELAGEVRLAHSRGKIDRVSARRYLSRRIVAHLADPRGRPYVLAAVQLPEVTPALLREVVIPVVDGRPDVSAADANKVFVALAASRWLTHTAEGRRALHFHPDVRSLALRLIEAGETDLLTKRIRKRAIAFHDARKSPADRAFALYHRLAGGEPPGRIANRASVLRYLAPVLRDLPEEARAALQDANAAAAPTSTAATDDEWRAHLEGSGHDEGQGARLLKRGNAGAALALYRSRPTRAPGAPPPFVVQALADNAEWDTDEADVERLLDAIEETSRDGKLGAKTVTPLYWLTRLELLRRNAKLTGRHIEMLRRVLSPANPQTFSGVLPPIVAVAEAGAREELLGVRFGLKGRAVTVMMRGHLVYGIRSGYGTELTLPLDAVAVTQRDWSAQVQRRAGKRTEFTSANWAQVALDALHGQPYAAVAGALRGLDRTIKLEWNSDRAAGVLLLRGLTTEFLRPLRQALADRYRAPGGPDLLAPVARRTIEGMSIRPLEMDCDAFAARLEADPEAWFAALVGYADRCRLLPLLCETLTTACVAPDDATLRRVARSFLAWDKALCGGGSSAWE